MTETAIKDAIIEIIEHADLNQLKEIHGLLTNYFGDQDAASEWDSMSEFQKARVEESIQQANAGLGTPAKEAIKSIREKYGLNAKGRL